MAATTTACDNSSPTPATWPHAQPNPEETEQQQIATNYAASPSTAPAQQPASPSHFGSGRYSPTFDAADGEREQLSNSRNETDD
jgi:hypothetical protein